MTGATGTQQVAEMKTHGKPAPTIPFSRTAIVLVGGMLIISGAVWINWGNDFWLTPDQQGRWHFHRGEFSQAAEVFHDPIWQGIALYRGGEFEKAAQAFSRRDTGEGQYNQGNAWLMRGQYEQAIICYDRSLKKLPGWTDAIENREIAIARAALLSNTGGDMGDQKLGADEIVFDKNANQDGQNTEVGGDALSNEQIQAIWLRRLQTRPADFLKAKFAYQQAIMLEDTP